MSGFKKGEYIIYQNGDRFELGKIKRITDNGAFVWYSEGDTAAKTPFDSMHKLVNSSTVKATTLGGAMPEIAALARDLKDCRNELCNICGRYVNMHLGHCDGCRWHIGPEVCDADT